jgi:hypothetical protein
MNLTAIPQSQESFSRSELSGYLTQQAAAHQAELRTVELALGGLLNDALSDLGKTQAALAEAKMFDVRYSGAPPAAIGIGAEYDAPERKNSSATISGLWEKASKLPPEEQRQFYANHIRPKINLG